MDAPVTLDKLELEGKRVLLRTDYNVVTDGKVIDEFRIQASVETINYLLNKNCSIVLASHSGRPDGKRDQKLSLEPVAEILGKMIKRKVDFASDCVGEKAKTKASALKSGELLLLENLRFHPEEEANDEDFAKQLSELAQIYVDDAFATAHRAHASIVAITKFLPHAAGLLMQKEYETLHGLLEDPKRPFAAIVAGAKVSTKLEVLRNLLDIVDILVIGGAMANTFIAATGVDMGASIMEKELFDEAREIYDTSKQKQVELILPNDFVAATKIEAGADTRIVTAGQFENNELALDLGPKSVEKIKEAIEKAKTVFWNGTLGYAEIEAFAKASYKIAKAMAGKDTKSIIGGGDTAAYIDSIDMHGSFSFVSTGGGASLELLAGKPMPAIEALS